MLIRYHFELFEVCSVVLSSGFCSFQIKAHVCFDTIKKVGKWERGNLSQKTTRLIIRATEFICAFNYLYTK